LPTADSLEKEEEKDVDNFLDQLCIYGKKNESCKIEAFLSFIYRQTSFTLIIFSGSTSSFIGFMKNIEIL